MVLFPPEITINAMSLILIIIRNKRIDYDLNVVQQSVCLVIHPITVDNFAALFNCTPVDQASNSMVAPT